MSIVITLTLCLCVNPFSSAYANNGDTQTPYYSTGFCETPESYSALVEDCVSIYEAYADEIAQYQAMNKTRATTIPNSLDLSQLKYFPPIGNQGQQGSCVAWATGYYQFTFEKNKLLDITSTASNAASPAWLANLRTNSGGSIYIGEAYSILHELGALSCETMPYDDSNYTSWPSDYDAIREALNIRSLEKVKITIQNDNYITSNNSIYLQELKLALSLQHPVTTGINSADFNRGYYKLYNGEKVYYRAGSGINNHLVTVVGYNDYIWIDINENGIAEAAEYGALKIANSWGSSWGDDGFFWVSYDAINAISQVPGNWESDATTTRRPFFRMLPDHQARFLSIDVVEMKPLYISEISFATMNRQNIKLNAQSTLTTPTSTSNYSTTGGYYGANCSPGVFNGKIYLDLTPDVILSTYPCTQISTQFTITDYDFSETSQMVEAPLIGCNYKILDSLGNTVYTYPSSFRLENTSKTITKTFDMSQKGDVNYDGVITQADAQLVLRYSNGGTELSYAQLFFGDYNVDGVVNISDALAILQAAE